MGAGSDTQTPTRSPLLLQNPSKQQVKASPKQSCPKYVVLGLTALAVSVDWLAGNAHYIAAGCLMLCILVVVGANAHRRQERRSGASGMKSLSAYRYTWIAGVMLVGAGVLIALPRRSRRMAGRP